MRIVPRPLRGGGHSATLPVHANATLFILVGYRRYEANHVPYQEVIDGELLVSPRLVFFPQYEKVPVGQRLHHRAGGPLRGTHDCVRHVSGSVYCVYDIFVGRVVSSMASPAVHKNIPNEVPSSVCTHVGRCIRLAVGVLGRRPDISGAEVCTSVQIS